MHPDLYTMRSTLLASTWACMLLGCGGLAGTYRGDGERLREQLTLFPDSTYQHVWWTDIIMGDAGRWSLAGDTLRLHGRGRLTKQWLLQGRKLEPLADQHGVASLSEFKKRSARCDTLFWGR